MKIYKLQFFLIIAISVILFAGCSSKAARVAKPDFGMNTVNVIAVLPVENKTEDLVAPYLLRSKISQELYFKGYAKLSPDLIDRKLESSEMSDYAKKASTISPQFLRELLGADAVLHITLIESVKSTGIFYSPITLSMSCELRKAQSGEIIWSGTYRATSRNFAFTRKGAKMKTHKGYEGVIDEVVNKIIGDLPYGPNLSG
ncbi:MAG TPA: hypothetical protein ENN23_06185 [Deltaproteobacteria bacterium]|mgnify:CR=1 FL=1|nr:hypothetical protein [Deltaproteobacteria bacterium]